MYYLPLCATSSENIRRGLLISIQKDGGVIFYSISFTQLFEINMKNESSISTNVLSSSQYSRN